MTVLKTRSQLLTELERRLSRTWSLATSPSGRWSQEIALGVPEQVDDAQVEQVLRECAAWQDWASEHGAEVVEGTRALRGAPVRLPVRLRVASPEVAARMVGSSWASRFRAESWRHHLLEREFAVPDDVAARVMKSARSMDDVEFELLVRAGAWLRDNADELHRWSPRQVPVPGVHAKWLQRRGELLELLLGTDDLGLVDTRVRRVDLTYIDPVHRADPTARVHDTVVLGTPMEPQYRPEVVVISENLDTAVLFPMLERAVSVQGQGSSGAEKMVRVDWIRDAARTLYWGDIDAQGYEILDAYRAHGLRVSSILMDLDAIEEYHLLASPTDQSGAPLERLARRALPHLSKAERRAYEAITDPDPANTYPIRIEQERIPLDDALAAARRALGRR